MAPVTLSEGLHARLAAARMISAATGQGRLLSEVMNTHCSRLDGADRARAQRLAVETLRNIERCDRYLGPHLQNKPAPFPLAVLRLGVYELCGLGSAAHGVVNDLVDVARRGDETVNAQAKISGLVNAVLRRVSENGKTPDDFAALPVPKMSKWLRKVLVDDFGKKTIEAIEVVQGQPAPLDITVNPARGDIAHDLAAALGATVLPNGSLRLSEFGQVSSLPGFATGDWWVQDAAATFAVNVARVQKGERVLDLCAAPGGKTLQMAALGAHVTAVDISETRLKRLHENLARTGLKAEVIVADALEFDRGGYDVILLDAPCTGTGTMRRHPDLHHAKDGGDFPDLFALQLRLIDHALSLLAPNGRLIYCTCSLLIDEGEEQISDALARHPNLEVVRENLMQPGVASEWIGAGGGLRTRPDFWAELGGMDGFFIAELRKSPQN